MTQDKELEKLIKETIKKWYELPHQKRDMDNINNWIAQAILSAMWIDEIKLRELWGELYTKEPFNDKVLDVGLGHAYIKLLASHAQEIIKFEEV